MNRKKGRSNVMLRKGAINLVKFILLGQRKQLLSNQDSGNDEEEEFLIERKRIVVMTMAK